MVKESTLGQDSLNEVVLHLPDEPVASVFPSMFAKRNERYEGAAAAAALSARWRALPSLLGSPQEAVIDTRAMSSSVVC